MENDILNNNQSVFQNDDNYVFKLSKFEGPLDLLLYLIQKSEIDIYDIPIHEITEQYLKYLSMMKEYDINLSAEFIVMAANLIYIKSKMLLPAGANIEEDYFEDPRTELVTRLLEYQQFKNAAEELKQIEGDQANIFFRASDQITFEFNDKENWVDVNLFDLINIFSRVLKEVDNSKREYIMPETVTVNMKIEELKLKLDTEDTIQFTSLFESQLNLWEIIVTFLAILELVKQKLISVKQHKLFGDIKIIKREKGDPGGTK